MKVSGLVRRIALWVLDAICVSVSFLCATWLRFHAIGISNSEDRTSKYLILILILLVTFLNFVMHRNRGFMKRNGVREFGVVLRYNCYLILGIALSVTALRIEPTPSRLMLLYFFIINAIVMQVARAIAKSAARHLLANERMGSNIVMIVDPSLRRNVERRFDTGASYKIVGWLELSNGDVSGSVDGSDVRVPLDELANTLSDHKVDDVFAFAPGMSERDSADITDVAERMGANCHIALSLLDPSLQGAKLDRFGGYPTLSYSGRGSSLYLNGAKRLIDILISALVVVVAFIPGCILALIIALQSKGAPFYTQERLGLNGRHFKLIKFRSMVSDANNVEKYFTPEQLREWRLERKVDNDPRITGIGRFLRKTSLDEFPQFINVFKGDMSIVGPRPIVDDEIANYGSFADEFLSIRPGITGWWQVEARNDADYASGRRQELELYYVRHASWTLDWNIFKRTFGAVFHGTGK